MNISTVEERLRILEDKIGLYLEPLIEAIANRTLAPEGHLELNPLIRWIVREYMMEPIKERRDFLRKLFNHFAVRFPGVVKNYELPEEVEEKIDTGIFEK